MEETAKKESVTLNDLINETEEKKEETKKTEEKKTEVTESSNTKSELKPVSIVDIVGEQPETITAQKAAQNEIFADLDKAIDRTKEELKPIIAKGKEIIIKDQLKAEELKEEKELKEKNDEEDEEDNADNTSSSTNENDAKEETSKTINIEEDVDEDDDDDDDTSDSKEDDASDETVLTEEQRTKIINEFKAQVKEVIKPVRNKLDLSKFTIKTKAASVSKVLSVKGDSRHVSDWVLPNSNKSVSVSELSGVEIEKLNIDPKVKNKINAFKTRYSTIYDHIIDPNKPKTLEEWLKTVSFFDIAHLNFAVYKACFENSNYIPYICPNKSCNNTFVEKKNISDMVKYGNDKDKEKFNKLFEKDTTSSGSLGEAELMQVSDDYVVALRVPTIYNVIFENSVLDTAFTDKYAELLGVIAFIETIYVIDKIHNELVPIDPAPVPNDLLKTVKRKIRNFSKILAKLKSDEFTTLRDKTTSMSVDNALNVSYVIPGTVCPKCKTKIDEYEQDPITMVFTRHQLTTIANS